MSEELQQGEFRPELLSRRGELISWSAVLVVAAAWVILVLNGFSAPIALVVLEILLLLASSAISLGNWMDRRTVLRLEPDGVAFENGLRSTRLAWDDIREVRVYSSGWSSKVRVSGDDGHFSFRTLGEVRVRGETRDRIGFVQGRHILNRIVEAAGLREIKPADAQAGTRYYARE